MPNTSMRTKFLFFVVLLLVLFLLAATFVFLGMVSNGPKFLYILLIHCQEVSSHPEWGRGFLIDLSIEEAAV